MVDKETIQEISQKIKNIISDMFKLPAFFKLILHDWFSIIANSSLSECLQSQDKQR